MTKTKRTAINALVGLTQLVMTGALSLIVNRLVMAKLGSDYNGVNATIAQVIVMLSLLEGGFTTASLVILYKPYVDEDYDKVNTLLSTTRSVFNRVGLYSLGIGLLVSITYPLIVKSDLSYFELAAVFLISVMPLSFNFAVVSKFRLVFQAAHREYIVTLIQFVGTLITQAFSVIILQFNPNIIWLRMLSSIVSILVGLAIGYTAMRTFTFIDLNRKADVSLIKGTKDVLIGNVTYFFYSSLSVIFLSTFVGTKATSVFSVYNSIVLIVISVVTIIITSAQNALGQVIAEEDMEKTYKVFVTFEYVSIIAVCTLFSITYSLIIQFVTLYTARIADANYIDHPIAILLVLTSVFQLLHIPSGLCISLHGKFRAMRNIQLSACFLVIIASVIGALGWGIYGIIGAKLITSLFIACAEIYYVRIKILKKSVLSALRVLIPNTLAAGFISVFIQKVSGTSVVNLSRFLQQALLNTITITAFMCICNLVLFPNLLKDLRSYSMVFLKHSAKSKSA